MVNETRLTAYAIYDKADQLLESIAIVNLEMFNSTQPANDRPYTKISLPSSFVNGTGGKIKVRRLTAPGVEVKQGITFAGQHVDSDGKIVGNQTIEQLMEDHILVGAGEAILVSLS